MMIKEWNSEALSRRLRRIGFALPVLALLFPSPSEAMFSAWKTHAWSFSFTDVASLAHDLAQKPYQAPPPLPEPFHSLTYDQWRDIRYHTRDAIWRDEKLPFNVEFFHLGGLYNTPVTMNVIEAGQPRRISFDPKLFDYGKTGLDGKVPADLGFAGFRLHFPLNRKSYKDEFIVFLGASYFRAIAQNQVYGLSARGIAVNTALPSGEQFPWFKEFWIQRPRRGDREITVYALLDGESLTGAYQFVIRPGHPTSVRVDAQLFLRQSVDQLGVAPLTGMFLFDETKTAKTLNDFRPEAHDCDGLSLSLDKQEWLWRPLVNPDRLFVNTFHVNSLHGFGLMQRDENYDHYLDLEQHSEKRPSVWILPRGEWGPGSVELIQIPTARESDDNIVAFWVSDHKPSTKDPIPVSYTLQWSSAQDFLPPKGYVTYTNSAHLDDGRMQFILEFKGEPLTSLDASAHVTAAISAPDGVQVQDVVVQKNEMTSGWRLVFKLKLPEKSTVEQILPQKKEAIELRAALQQDGHPLTETWSYAFDQP